MAIRITSNGLTETGLQDTKHSKDKTFTLAEIKAYNKARFSEMLEDNILDQMVNLCSVLGVTEDDAEVLSTYVTTNGEFFSIPYIQIDKEGFLILTFGKVVIPLEYIPGVKSYMPKGIDLKLKPLAYVDDTKQVKAAYMSLKMEIEVDGLTDEVEYAISCKACKEVDLKAIVVKLQKGEIPDETLLQKMGSGGGFTKALKPWMLTRGFYQVVDSGEVGSYMYEGKSIPTRVGIVSPIDPVTGELSDETISVGMLAVPFKPMHLASVSAGYVNLIQIDGGYLNSDGNKGTIGFSAMVGQNPGEFNQKELHDFVKKSRAEMIRIRRGINSSNILSVEKVNQLREEYLAPKEKADDKAVNSSVPAPEKELVSESTKPDIDDIPF